MMVRRASQVIISGTRRLSALACDPPASLSSRSLSFLSGRAPLSTLWRSWNALCFFCIFGNSDTHAVSFTHNYARGSVSKAGERASAARTFSSRSQRGTSGSCTGTYLPTTPIAELVKRDARCSRRELPSSREFVGWGPPFAVVCLAALLRLAGLAGFPHFFRGGQKHRKRARVPLHRRSCRSSERCSSQRPSKRRPLPRQLHQYGAARLGPQPLPRRSGGPSSLAT